MANFLREHEKEYRALAFLDPCGMQLKWNSLESLDELGVDVWILVPLGLGVNRLLKKNGDISEAWMNKLVDFLGISEKEINEYFYIRTGQQTLFNNHNHVMKKSKTIELAGKLYRERLKEIFKFVSKPFLMKNEKNNVMYHFLLCTNNKTAVKIANDVVSKWSS